VSFYHKSILMHSFIAIRRCKLFAVSEDRLVTDMSEIGKQWLPPATSRGQPTRGGPPAWGPAPP
jgi:hypothetical protein